MTIGEFGLCNQCRHAAALTAHSGRCDEPATIDASVRAIDVLAERGVIRPSVIISRMLAARALVSADPICKCPAFAPRRPALAAVVNSGASNVVPLNAGAATERVAEPLVPLPRQAPALLDAVAGEGEAH